MPMTMNQDDNYDSDDDESISAYMESSPILRLMGEISEKGRIISSLQQTAKGFGGEARRV